MILDDFKNIDSAVCIFLDGQTGGLRFWPSIGHERAGFAVWRGDLLAPDVEMRWRGIDRLVQDTACGLREVESS